MDPSQVLTKPPTSDDAASAAVRQVHDLLAQQGMQIPVRLWDGTELGPEAAGYRLVLRHPWSLRALLVPPSDLAAGEAYVFDDIDVEGSMIAALQDVTDLRGDLGWGSRASLARLLLSLPRPPRRGDARRARLTGWRHSKTRDERAVRFHYDVGNDFYALLLDERMVYSCAYFSDEDAAQPTDDRAALDRAQLRKLDMICRKLRLREGRTLLDIGCGWGALVLHAAKHHGARAVGITLSEAQAAVARERLAREGLADRVEIRVQDYRETTGTFDAVASVGMFEHVGTSRFRTFFARAQALTAPGGLFLHHAITTGRRQEVRNLARDRGSFIGRYVFPDGALAPAHVAVRLLQEAGFELLDVHQLRPHYARTLRAWLANLERNADATRAEAGDPVYRTWRAYLAGSAVGFTSGDLGIVQILGGKGAVDIPYERGWMEPARSLSAAPR